MTFLKNIKTDGCNMHETPAQVNSAPGRWPLESGAELNASLDDSVLSNLARKISSVVRG